MHRAGRVGSTTLNLNLPDGAHPRDVWCTIELEDGRVRRTPLITTITGSITGPEGSGGRTKSYRFRLEPDGVEPCSPGLPQVHCGVVGCGGERTAHQRSFVSSRSTGLGCIPSLSMRCGPTTTGGIGSYTDLAELGKWVKAIGCSMLGALPVYPILDPSVDPSPYLPVSRLDYNDLYIDPVSLPELAIAPEARQLLAADEFRRRITAAHRSKMVDYEAVARLRRQVLAPMADALVAADSKRHLTFCSFFEEHPELLAYASISVRPTTRLRGAPERKPCAWGDAPVAETTLNYHLYAQWIASQQLSSAAEAIPLYADIRSGSTLEASTPFGLPNAFVAGVRGTGAPPDCFYAGGQDCGVPSLHPGRIREDGYSYLIASLRRAFRHAAYLRIDHVMGLERLYWISEGFDAQHGAYVSYRADEIHAVVSLEAARAGVVVVGEDLGTVSEGVRSRMAEDRMLRSWVLQFESTPEEPLPAAHARALASWGTHDLPRASAPISGGKT